MASTGVRRDGREGRGAWWNRLVYVTTATSLYPLRVPPNTLAPTPAASLATAAALGCKSRTRRPWCTAHRYPKACSYVSPTKGCAHGDVHTRVYDVAPRAGAASVLDDQARAVWIASATVEPAIAMVFGEALACVHGATGLDLTTPVWRCPEALRPRDDAMARPCRTDPEGLLRRTEEAFAAKANDPNWSLRGPASCAADYECLVRVSQKLAEECGAETALDVSERLSALAETNGALLRGVADRRGAKHEDELAALHEAHANAIRAFSLQRIEVHPVDGEVAGAGRRLSKRTRPRASSRRSTRTSGGCGTRPRAARSRRSARRRTARTRPTSSRRTRSRRARGCAPAPRATARGTGTVCVDCHFPRQTVACRVHFALVGQRIQQIHRDKRNAEQQHDAARIAAVQAHVRRKLNEACCVRMHDAHGLPTGRKECGAVYCKHVAAHKRNERVARVLRQLHREDPKARAAAGIDLHVGLDLLDPSGHVDPLCRNRSRHDAECIGRSIVHHMAEKHGVDPASIRRRVEAVGGTLGGGVRPPRPWASARSAPRRQGRASRRTAPTAAPPTRAPPPRSCARPRRRGGRPSARERGGGDGDDRRHAAAPRGRGPRRRGARRRRGGPRQRAATLARRRGLRPSSAALRARRSTWRRSGPQTHLSAGGRCVGRVKDAWGSPSTHLASSGPSTAPHHALGGMLHAAARCASASARLGGARAARADGRKPPAQAGSTARSALRPARGAPAERRGGSPVAGATRRQRR